jgi:hypothetical protein
VAGFEGSSDFVFAFRLRRLRVSRRSGVASHDEYTTGAMYDENGGARAQDLPFVVEGVAEEDASAQDFGWEDMAEVVMESEDECVCVLPKSK